LVGLLLVSLLLALIAGLQWYLDPESKLSIVQRRDLVQGLASAGQAFAVFLTGAVGLIGLFFTWQNTSQARASTQRTLELAEQGQITDRFTQAVDQLGAVEGDKKIMETRMGGIYALGRIAKESAEDYWPIMQILASYVQQHAPWQRAVDSEGDSSAAEPSAAESPDAESPDAESPDAEPLRFGHKNPDVQACLTVIGRRTQTSSEEKQRLILERTDISFAFLPEANLTRVWLVGSNLTSANLWKTNFGAASLSEANFHRAYLAGANLTDAILDKATLDRAYVDEATVLNRAHLNGADLSTVYGLTQNHVDAAFGDEDTKLPPNLNRPAHWLPGKANTGNS
jgi:hypothetical protein